MTAGTSAHSGLRETARAGKGKPVFVRVCLAIFVVKLLLLLFDHEPGFHFGDSGAYLATALIGWIPPDRSFTYGFLIRPFVAHSHSLIPLLFLQTSMSAAASVITGLLLNRFYGASLPFTVSFALLSAVEPLQLMSERYLMAETAATFGFSLFTFVCFAYLQRKKLWMLILCQLIGVVLISLRFSFLPLILLLSVALPILAEASRSAIEYRPLLTSLLLSIIASQALLLGYRHLYGFLARAEPAYLSRDGDFLVADMAPLIKPVDFPDPARRVQLFREITIPLNGIDRRRLHRWLPGGVCAAILDVTGGNEDAANQVARSTAIHAMRRDPYGVVSLAVQTYKEFFNLHKVQWALKIDQGKFVEPTSNDVAMIQERFGVDASERRFHSLTRRWQASAAPWCWLMLLLPFGYAAELALHWRQASRSDYLLLLMSFTFLLAAIVPVEIANPRYLVPLPWLSVLMFGVICLRVAARWPNVLRKFEL